MSQSSFEKDYISTKIEKNAQMTRTDDKIKN